jgi:hypothetical protein
MALQAAPQSDDIAVHAKERFIMNMIHAQPFLDVMHAKASVALEKYLDPDITLRSPFLPEPFVGRDAVVGVLKAGIVAIQKKLAPLVGVPALELVEQGRG